MRYYPIAWNWNTDNDIMNNFLKKHDIQCWKDDKTIDLNWGNNMYGFRTENDNDGFILDCSSLPYKLIKQ